MSQLNEFNPLSFGCAKEKRRKEYAEKENGSGVKGEEHKNSLFKIIITFGPDLIFFGCLTWQCDCGNNVYKIVIGDITAEFNETDSVLEQFVL